MILGVLPEGPAARAGLQAGDVVLEVDGQRVHRGRVPRIYHMLNAHRAGDRLSVRFRRQGREQTTIVECGQLPFDGGHGRIAATAESGEAWAMADLGLRLSGGACHGVKPAASELDRAAGRAWLERSRAAGHAAAPLMLASLPKEGLSGDAAAEAAIETLETARRLSRRSIDDPVYLAATRKQAEMLISAATSTAGDLADGSRAVELYEDLADLGVTDAAYQLALIYENGRGVSPNRQEALTWYQKAAAEDHHTSQTKLGMVAYYGQG